MNIATALNRKYLEYTAVMLCSLCENNHEHIDAYILHSELTDKDINTLKNSLSKYDITIIPLMINRSDFDTRLPRNSQWSIETYYRLMLMDILPDNIDRILYLDVDLIINGSVEEFYHVDFKGDEVIVADDSNGKRSRDTFGSKQAEMFKDMLDNGFRYFNAGVMLFNVQEIRKTHNFNTYMKAVEEWDYAMEAPDQDILNYVHGYKASYIDYMEYNLFARIAHNQKYTYEDVKNNVIIIHFAGDKPWDNTNCHFDIEQLWWDYAKKTIFYNELLEKMQQNLMSDNSVEKIIDNLIKENSSLKDKISTLLSINYKLMNMLS